MPESTFAFQCSECEDFFVMQNYTDEIEYGQDLEAWESDIAEDKIQEFDYGFCEPCGLRVN